MRGVIIISIFSTNNALPNSSILPQASYTTRRGEAKLLALIFSNTSQLNIHELIKCSVTFAPGMAMDLLFKILAYYKLFSKCSNG